MQSGSLRKHEVGSFDKMSKLSRLLLARIQRLASPGRDVVPASEQVAAEGFASGTTSGAGGR